jgi:RNA 3'-terminal phosphate cyclase (ATP)
MKEIRAISLASHLEKERVAERMARRLRTLLETSGHQARVEIRNDVTAVQKGAALLAWAETDRGCLLGADQAGKPGRRSERIAKHVVTSLIEDLRTGATTDRHLADQLILFAALAEGETQYLIPRTTDHVVANLWLVGKVLGVKTELEGQCVKVHGAGFLPGAAQRRLDHGGTGKD